MITQTDTFNLASEKLSVCSNSFTLSLTDDVPCHFFHPYVFCATYDDRLYIASCHDDGECRLPFLDVVYHHDADASTRHHLSNAYGHEVLDHQIWDVAQWACFAVQYMILGKYSIVRW